MPVIAHARGIVSEAYSPSLRSNAALGANPSLLVSVNTLNVAFILSFSGDAFSALHTPMIRCSSYPKEVGSRLEDIDRIGAGTWSLRRLSLSLH